MVFELTDLFGAKVTGIKGSLTFCYSLDLVLTDGRIITVEPLYDEGLHIHELE